MDTELGPSTQNHILSPPKRRRTAITVSEKVMILNSYQYLHNNWPQHVYWSIGGCTKKTAEMLGISAVTVGRVLKENKISEQFKPPKKTGPKKDSPGKVEEYTPSALGQKVHDFLNTNEAQVIGKASSPADMHTLESLLSWEPNDPEDYLILRRIIRLINVHLPEEWQQWRIRILVKEVN